jgi:hypothetical protein
VAAFKWDQLHWYSFKNVSGTLVKVEFASETHNGVAARRIVTTVDGKKIQQSWWDQSVALDPADGANLQYVTASESVTIPKGTYPCTKYSPDHGSEEFWVCDGAPLPLKYPNIVTGKVWEVTDRG